MTSRDRLYDLLPALYRARDAENDGALRALLAIIDDEFTAVEGDIDQLYDNWFIETCEPWVVPYIGDLLGVTPIQPIGETNVNLRGYVANTLGYRRRKGTVAVLEQLARDVTGWPARGVEFFQRLATTEHMNHVRPRSLATVQLKDSAGLAHVDGPFETATHTADVRSIALGRGRYNIPNVGLFLWRLQSYPLQRVDARPVAAPADGRFRVDPLGRDMPLFNTPKAEQRLTDLAVEVNVPGRLRRRALYDELTALRAALALGKTPARTYFDDQPVLRIHLNGDPAPLAPEEIAICNLEDPPQPHPDGWRRPPALIDGQAIKAGIDPELGRVALPVGAPAATTVQVFVRLRLQRRSGRRPLRPLAHRRLGDRNGRRRAGDLPDRRDQGRRDPRRAIRRPDPRQDAGRGGVRLERPAGRRDRPDRRHGQPHLRRKPHRRTRPGRPRPNRRGSKSRRAAPCAWSVANGRCTRTTCCPASSIAASARCVSTPTGRT